MIYEILVGLRNCRWLIWYSEICYETFREYSDEEEEQIRIQVLSAFLQNECMIKNNFNCVKLNCLISMHKKIIYFTLKLSL